MISQIQDMKKYNGGISLPKDSGIKDHEDWHTAGNMHLRGLQWRTGRGDVCGGGKSSTGRRRWCRKVGKCHVWNSISNDTVKLSAKTSILKKGTSHRSRLVRGRQMVEASDPGEGFGVETFYSRNPITSYFVISLWLIFKNNSALILRATL